MRENEICTERVQFLLRPSMHKHWTELAKAQSLGLKDFIVFTIQSKYPMKLEPIQKLSRSEQKKLDKEAQEKIEKKKWTNHRLYDKGRHKAQWQLEEEIIFEWEKMHRGQMPRYFDPEEFQPDVNHPNVNPTYVPKQLHHLLTPERLKMVQEHMEYKKTHPAIPAYPNKHKQMVDETEEEEEYNPGKILEKLSKKYDKKGKTKHKT